MPEIKHTTFSKSLAEAKDGKRWPIIVFYGEPAIYEKALADLVSVFLPGSLKEMNYEIADDSPEGLTIALRKVNTFSLMAEPKVTAVLHSRIFYTKADDARLFEQAKTAWEEDKLDRAAACFAAALGMSKLSYADARGKNGSKTLGMDEDLYDDGRWVEEIVNHGEAHGPAPAPPEDQTTILARAIKHGFPEANTLIIATDTVDKRKTLYKTMAAHGLVVDCSVPKGNRMADKKAQDAVLAERAAEITRKAKKRLDRAALETVKEMTGFDLLTFSANIDKLIQYVGKRDRISVSDVKAVLSRTKKDPVYELTNALAERDPAKALFFIGTLLEGELHPLQVLAAMTNQVRKLILAKDFTRSEFGEAWRPGSAFNYFRDRILPAVAEYDKKTLDFLEVWDPPPEKSGSPSKAKKRKKKPDTDALLGKQAPYPLYKTVINSDGYTQEELLRALDSIADADARLKRSTKNPKLLLEKTLFDILEA